MKKLIFIVLGVLLICACQKDNTVLQSDQTTKTNLSSVTNTKLVPLTTTSPDGTKLTIIYTGNGVYDVTIVIPYNLLVLGGSYGYWLAPLDIQLGNHGRAYEFTTSFSPGWYYYYYFGGIDGQTTSFTISAKPTPPNSSAGWTSLYRYANVSSNSHAYSGNWEEFGSYSNDFQFYSVQGYMYTIRKDPYTNVIINPLPNNLVVLNRFYNASLNDYMLSTGYNPPTGYINQGALGDISTVADSRFNSTLNEYVNANNGLHLYASPTENLSSSWIFVKTIGYLVSNPWNIVGNTPVSKNFTKTNCGTGYTASITETIPANTFYSDTQLDANTQALNYLNANGQSYANSQSQSNCVPIIVPPPPTSATFTMKNSTSSGYQLTFSGSGSNINISLPASTNSLTSQIPIGTYTLTISPSGMPASHNIILGNRSIVNGAGTTFYNVDISSGSSDLSLIID